MKKIVPAALIAVALFIAGSRAGCWAEEPVPAGGKLFVVTLDLVKDAVYQKVNTGEFAEKGTAGDPGRTYLYAGDEALTFFNLKKEMFDTSDLFVKFGYANDNFGGLLRFALNARTLDDSSPLSVPDLIDLYYGWAKTGFFKIWIGRDEYRGVIDRFQNFDDFLAEKNDGFGPVIARYDYLTSRTLSLTGSDVTNLGKDILGNGSTVLIGEFTRKPVTVSFAANNLFSQIAGKASGESYYEFGYTDTGSAFGARVEAAGLFNFLDLAAVYKFQHWDRNYDDQTPQYLPGGQPLFESGMGLDHHLFGVLATAKLPDIGLGLSVAYSGYFRVHRKTDAAFLGGWTSYTYPFWHGIDLRAGYTGVSGLSLTLNNNVSFAAVKGDADSGSFVTSFWENNGDAQDVGSNQEQNALVIYNAFAAAYQLTGALTLKAQTASRFARIQYIYNGSKTRFVDSLVSLGFYLGADWQINSNLGLRGGVDIRLKNYLHDELNGSFKAGVFEWGIPFGLRLIF
ncbi:MAG: hypothetical protein LBF77_02690 [Spirochaetaceae bacterium]|jgi:hypothetical protein|nr:hypothetical protein [Spirochaetaceae bacterium]